MWQTNRTTNKKQENAVAKDQLKCETILWSTLNMKPYLNIYQMQSNDTKLRNEALKFPAEKKETGDDKSQKNGNKNIQANGWWCGFYHDVR